MEINSPTNFAGETGTIEGPAAVPALPLQGIAALALSLLAGGLWQYRRRFSLIPAGADNSRV